jgi:hypothetical protein
VSSPATQSPTWPDERVERIFAEFKAATVNPEEFDHEGHVLVAWRYLQDDDLLPAIEKYSDALKTLTRKLGDEWKYHETITWFYMIAVAERLAATGKGDWPGFKFDNKDLFARKPGLIQQFYSDAHLMSEIARQVFVLPDITPSWPVSAAGGQQARRRG